jgi:hypothetical protein
MNLARFFANGRVADLLLVVMAIEFAALTITAPSKARAGRALDLVFTLAPGACLTVALRMALTGASWPWVALWVTAALPFHVADLLRRRR